MKNSLFFFLKYGNLILILPTCSMKSGLLFVKSFIFAAY